MNAKIVIVDDHKIFSESLKLVLESNNFTVKNLNDPEVAIKYIKADSYDVVITDVEMPNMTGVDFVKQLKAIEHTFQKAPKYIVLTSHTKTKIFKQLYHLGVDAYLSKNISQLELISVVNKVLQDEKYFEKEIYEAYLHSGKHVGAIEFTPREMDVLKLILDEKTTGEIADELKISAFTVEGHRKNLMQKTNSKNVVGLIKYAIANNLC